MVPPPTAAPLLTAAPLGFLDRCALPGWGEDRCALGERAHAQVVSSHRERVHSHLIQLKAGALRVLGLGIGHDHSVSRSFGTHGGHASKLLEVGLDLIQRGLREPPREPQVLDEDFAKASRHRALPFKGERGLSGTSFELKNNAAAE